MRKRSGIQLYIHVYTYAWKCIYICIHIYKYADTHIKSVCACVYGHMYIYDMYTCINITCICHLPILYMYMQYIYAYYN